MSRRQDQADRESRTPLHILVPRLHHLLLHLIAPILVYEGAKGTAKMCHYLAGLYLTLLTSLQSLLSNPQLLKILLKRGDIAD